MTTRMTPDRLVNIRSWCHSSGVVYELLEHIDALQGEVSYWRTDSATAWDKCEERRLEGVKLTLQNEIYKEALLDLDFWSCTACIENKKIRDIAIDDAAEDK